MLKWSFAEMLIGCFYLWDGLSLRLHVLRTVWRWSGWGADDWCLFLRKLDQMNVYGGRSTVPGDVRKWSNECGAATRLWGRQAVDLMPEVLHLMLLPSDALAVECDARHAAPGRETARCTLAVVWGNCQGCIWCRCHQMHWRLSQCQRGCTRPRTVRCTGEVVWLPGCCTRPWNGQMHAGGCLWRKPVAASWLQRHSRCCRGFAPDAEAVGCTGDFVCFSGVLRLNGCLLTQARWCWLCVENVMPDGCTRCWCIRCTGEVVWCQKGCTWPRTVRCTGEVVWLPGCCTRSWNGQMHAGGCLLTRTR